jgi:hypothetical protein
MLVDPPIVFEGELVESLDFDTREEVVEAVGAFLEDGSLRLTIENVGLE